MDSASETLAAETFEKLLKAHQAKTEDVQKSKLEQTELLKVPAQVVLVDPSYLTSEKKIEGLEPILELWNLEEHIRFHTDQLLKNNSWTNFTPTFSEQSLRNTVEAFSKSLKQYTLKLQNSWEAGKVEPEKIQQVTKIWQEKTDRLITWLSNETGNHVKNTTKINQTVLEELRNSCILSSDPETTFNNACQKSFAKYTVSLSIPITLQAETDNLKFEIARKKINAVDETIQNLQPILVENLKALDLYDTLFNKEEQALSPEKFALLVSSRKQMILDHLTTIRETPEVKNVTSYADKRKIEEDPNKFIKKQKITNAINDFESMFFQQIVPEPVFIPERLIQRVPVNIGDCLMTIQLQENNFNFKYQGTHADDAQLIAFLNKHKNDFLGVKLYQTKAPLLTKEKVWEKIITFVDQFITILETEDTEKRNQIIEGIREDQFKDGLSAIFSEAQLSSTQREYKNLATSAGKELLKQYFSNTINTVTNNGSFFTDLYIKMLLLQTEKSINFFDDNTNSANFGATLRQDLQKIKKLQSLLSADKISRGSSYPTISDLHQATKERLDPINVYKRNLNSDLELNTSDNLYNAVALLENFTPVHHKNMESLNILLTNFPQKNQLTELEKKTLLRILSGQDHLNYAETRGSLLKDAVQYLKETIDKYQIILTKELEQAVTLKNSAVTSSLRIQLFYIAQIDKRLSKQVSNVPNLNNNRNKDIEPLLRNREQINSFFEGLTKSFIEVNTIEVNPSNLYSTECFVDLRRNLPLNSTIKNIYAKDLNKKADEFQRLANHLDRNMKYQSQQIKQKIDNLEIRFPYFNPTLDPNGKQNPRSESLFKRFKIVYMDHTFNLRRSKKYHDDKDVIHLAVLLDYYFAQHYNEDNNRAHEIDESEDYKIDYKKDYYNSYHRRGKLLVTYIRNTLSKIHGFNFSTAYRENVMQTYLNSLAPRQMEHADINAVYASKEFQNLSNILYTNILIWSEFMENSKIYEKYLVKSPHEHLNRYAQSAVVDLRPDRLLMLVNSDEAETTSQSALDKRVSSYVRTNYNSKILDYLFNEDITRTPVFPDLLKTEEAKNTIKGFYLDLEDLKLATIGDNEIQRKINYYNAPNNANKKRILIEYEKLIKTSSAINNCFTSLTEFNALYTRIENHPTLNINTLNAIFQEYVTNVVMPRLRERGYNDPDITTDRIIVLLLWTRSFIPAMSKQIQEFAFNNPDFIQPVKSFFTNPVENLPRYQPDTKIEIIKPARVDLDLEELSNIKRYGLEVPLILPEINKIYSGNSRNITIQIQSEEQGIEEKHIKELYGYVFPEANGKDQQIFYITATKHLDTRVSSSSPENSLLDKIANIAKQLKNGDTLNLLLPLHGGKGEGFITSMPVVNLSDFMIAADDNSIPKKLSPTQKVYTIPKIIDTIVTNLKPGVQLKTLCISHAGCYGAADANRINGRYVTNSNSFLSRIVAALKHKGYTQIENIFVFAHTNESVHIQQTDNPIDTYIPRSATVENDSLPMGYYVNIKTNKDGFFLIEKETNAQNRINIHERLENQSRRTIQNFTQPANDLDADGNGPTCSSNVRNYSEINNGFENLNQTRHKILAVPKSPNNLNIDTKIYNPINVSEDAIDYAMDAIKEGYENYFSNQAILNKKSTDQIIPKAPLNETKNQTQSCAAETLKRVQAKYLKRY